MNNESKETEAKSPNALVLHACSYRQVFIGVCD